jgi:hypothetical protein
MGHETKKPGVAAGLPCREVLLAYCLRMTFSDLALPAEADFAKAGNR